MKKRFIFVLLLLILTISSLYANTTEADPSDILLSNIPIKYGDESFRQRILERTKGERDPIGLVLTGGSARAFAHLGVLRYLEEEGIEPDFIISNSMGSLIAMLYAAGMSPDQIESVIQAADLSTYFKLTIPLNGGLLDPSEFKTTVSNVVGRDTNIEDLPIPVMIIEQDMVTKREVQISEGNFADIYIASFAIPVYFPPQEYRGHLLLDGGISNLAPIGIAFEYTDTVIASTTFYDNDLISLKNPVSIINVAMEINKRRTAALDLIEYQDKFIWIRCAVEKFSFMDFAKADLMADIGYESAKEKEEELSLLYKNGLCEEIQTNREKFQTNIDKLNSNLRLFNRIEAYSSTQILSLGTHTFQTNYYPYYLRDSYDIGLEYTWKYRPIELSILAGGAIDLSANKNQSSKLLISGNVNYYPFNRLRLGLYGAFTFENDNRDWIIPTIYARESIDLILLSTQRFNLQINQAFEIFHNPLNKDVTNSLFSAQVQGNIVFPIADIKFSAAYLYSLETSAEPERHLGQVNAKTRFYVSDEIRMFTDLSITWRFAFDSLGGVPLYAKDGFTTNNEDVFEIGQVGPTSNHLLVVPLSIGYAFNQDPTFGEMLTLRYTEVAAFCDLLIRPESGKVGFSTGLSLQSAVLLIGLQEFPLTLKMGYDSLENAFFWGLRFAVKK